MTTRRHHERVQCTSRMYHKLRRSSVAIRSGAAGEAGVDTSKRACALLSSTIVYGFSGAPAALRACTTRRPPVAPPDLGAPGGALAPSLGRG